MPRQKIEKSRKSSIVFLNELKKLVLGGEGDDFDTLAKKRTIEMVKEVEKVKKQYSDLDLSSAYLHLILSGERPVPEWFIKSLVRAFSNESTEEEISLQTDRLLILAGHAPSTFKYINRWIPNKHTLTAKGNKFVLQQATNLSKLDYSYKFAIISSIDDMIEVGVEGDLGKPWGIHDGAILLLQPMSDETCLENFDVGLIYLCKSKDVQLVQFQKSNGHLYISRTPENPKLEKADPNHIKIVGRINHVYHKPLNIAKAVKSRKQIRTDLTIGIAPFQDALLPVVGKELGWFEEENINIKLVNTAWHEWGEILKHNADAIIFSNIYSFLANFSYDSNRKNKGADLVFMYGVNLFNQGFELIAKDNSLKSYEDYVSEDSMPDDEVGEPEREHEIISKVLAGIKDKKIFTIVNSDWAAQIYTLAKVVGAGLEIKYQIADNIGAGMDHTILEPCDANNPILRLIDAGQKQGVLTNDIRINGSAELFIGSLPQTLKLKSKHKWKTLLGSSHIPGPFPINGFIARRPSFLDNGHQDLLLRFLKVWFRITRMVNNAKRSKIAAQIVENAFRDQLSSFEGYSPTSLDASDIIKAWGQECFPSSPIEIEEKIKPVWEADWDRSSEYLSKLPNSKFELIDKSCCIIEDVQRAFIDKYGEGKFFSHTLNE